MSGPYFDTGIAIKLVVQEPLSAKVRCYVQGRRVSVPYCRLVELEIENALHALRFRRVITERQLAGARLLVADLLRAGRSRREDLSLDKIATETLNLVPMVTSKTGCRTLDLMHVAAARLLGSSEFVSTDQRQLAAAAACRLKVIDLGKGEV